MTELPSLNHKLQIFFRNHSIKNIDRLFIEFSLCIDKDVKYEKFLFPGLW